MQAEAPAAVAEVPAATEAAAEAAAAVAEVPAAAEAAAEEAAAPIAGPAPADVPAAELVADSASSCTHVFDEAATLEQVEAAVGPSTPLHRGEDEVLPQQAKEDAPAEEKAPAEEEDIAECNRHPQCSKGIGHPGECDDVNELPIERDAQRVAEALYAKTKPVGMLARWSGAAGTPNAQLPLMQALIVDDAGESDAAAAHPAALRTGAPLPVHHPPVTPS